MGTFRRVIFCLVFFCWELLFAVVIFSHEVPAGGAAASPSPQYGIENWTVEKGLPSNNVYTVFQSSDGYIWLGTMAGLIRFDGVRFVTFNTYNTDAFKSDIVRTIYEDREGNLWIGTGDGLLKFRSGQFSDCTPGEIKNSAILCFYEDRRGGAWIGTNGRGLFYKNKNDSIHYHTANGLSNPIVRSLFEDHEGNILASTDGGLNQVKDGIIKVFTCKDGLLSDVVGVICEDRENNLWIGTQKGLNQRKNGIFSALRFPPGYRNNAINTLFIDTSDTLWIGLVESGVIRLKNGQFTTSLNQEIPLRDIIYSIFQDREGTFWIGTANFGLNMLRPLKFSTVTTREGLSNDTALCVLEDHKENLWIGTYNGLNQWKDHQNKIFTTREGLSSNTISALCEDRFKNLWIGTFGRGLTCYKNNTFTVYTHRQHGLSNDTIWSIHEDYQGNLWVGTDKGLNRFDNGSFITYTTNEGLSHNVIRFIISDRENNLWIGTYGGGLNLYKNGKFKVFNTGHGLSHNMITHIYIDNQNTLWIGTMKGLNRFKDGAITPYYTRDGLFNDRLHQVFEDKKGYLWLGSAIGISRVKKEELNDFADGKIDKIHSYYYNEKDGMKSTVCSGGCQPAGFKSRDGRLYFSTLKGVTIVDPEQLPINQKRPPTIIEELFVDGEKINRWSSNKKQLVVLSPDTKRLEFHYTALSFVNPPKIRFRYKMEGYDKEWIEAGNQRSTIYTSLPSGLYDFKVMACNDDGIWNENPAALSFYLRPHFYQTAWFYILLGLFVIAAAFLGYRFRVRQLKAREKQLMDQVRLRTRDLQIAHDEIIESKKIIEEKNKHILDSIRYAGKIQDAVLRINKQMENVLSDYFILFKPRDIVSGDFYWFSHFEDKYFIAVADCTGHGVPGALLSMIGIMELNDLVSKKHIFDPALILNHLHLDFRNLLQQQRERPDALDGMDIGLCLIDMKKNLLSFAGAKRPLLIVGPGSKDKFGLSLIKGNRKPIGGHQKEQARVFNNVEIAIQPGTSLFLLSDGLVDQVDDKAVKFGYRRLESFLLEHAHLKMAEQKTLLLEELKNFQGSEEQRDDITLVGIRLKT